MVGSMIAGWLGTVSLRATVAIAAVGMVLSVLPLLPAVIRTLRVAEPPDQDVTS